MSTADIQESFVKSRLAINLENLYLKSTLTLFGSLSPPGDDSATLTSPLPLASRDQGCMMLTSSLKSKFLL